MVSTVLRADGTFVCWALSLSFVAVLATVPVNGTRGTAQGLKEQAKTFQENVAKLVDKYRPKEDNSSKQYETNVAGRKKQYRWGKEGENVCGHCRDGLPCDRLTGHCPDGCSDGFSGPPCLQQTNVSGRRKLYKWGENGQNVCGHCRNRSPCDKMTGHCPDGCSGGFYGLPCLEPCHHGTWGENCASNCGRCMSGVPCYHNSGLCPNGCAVGYYGFHCNYIKASPAGQQQSVNGGEAVMCGRGVFIVVWCGSLVAVYFASALGA